MNKNKEDAAAKLVKEHLTAEHRQFIRLAVRPQ